MRSPPAWFSVALVSVAALGPVLAEESLEPLESVEHFRRVFNDEEGKPRLVLLLSPT